MTGSRLPDVVRMECQCGCGVWFYQPRKKGRRKLFLNIHHWYREKWRREAGRKRAEANRRGQSEATP